MDDRFRYRPVLLLTLRYRGRTSAEDDGVPRVSSSLTPIERIALAWKRLIPISLQYEFLAEVLGRIKHPSFQRFRN